MYRKACYGIEVPYQDCPTVMQWHNQLFPIKQMAIEFCQQNRLPETSIVQLFRFEKLEYKEPAIADPAIESSELPNS